MGVGGVAEQRGPLGAERQDLGDERLGVALVAVVAAGDEVAPDLLAQVAARRVGEERLDAGAGVEHRPLALVAGPLGGRGHGGAHRGGQPGQLGLGGEQGDVAGLLGEDALAEGGEERGQPLVDGGHPLLGGGVEPGAGAHEGGVLQPGQPLLLGVEAGGLARLVDGGDAGEELLVLRDLVAEGGQPGRHGQLHRLVLGGGEAGAPDAEDARDPVEGPAGALQRRQGVLERGRGRVGGDGVDGPELLGHAGLQGGLEVGHLDRPEGRDAAVRAGPGLRDGVQGGGVLGCGGRRGRRDGLGRERGGECDCGGEGHGGSRCGSSGSTSGLPSWPVRCRSRPNRGPAAAPRRRGAVPMGCPCGAEERRPATRRGRARRRRPAAPRAPCPAP